MEYAESLFFLKQKGEEGDLSVNSKKNEKNNGVSYFNNKKKTLTKIKNQAQQNFNLEIINRGEQI